MPEAPRRQDGLAAPLRKQGGEMDVSTDVSPPAAGGADATQSPADVERERGPSGGMAGEEG